MESSVDRARQEPDAPPPVSIHSLGRLHSLSWQQAEPQAEPQVDLERLKAILTCSICHERPLSHG